MTICCIHLKDRPPVRLDIQGYRVDQVGSLEIVAPNGTSFGTFGPNEWSYIHVPGVPGWPCELDEQERQGGLSNIPVQTFLEGEDED